MFSTSLRPKASARICFVRSSQVGPRPPVVMMMSARLLAVSTHLRSRSGLSPTTVWYFTFMPIFESISEMSRASVFVTWPSSSSVPTEIISVS